MVGLFVGLIVCVVANVTPVPVKTPDKPPVVAVKKLDKPLPVKAIVWTASWCPACQQYKPVVEELKKEGWDITSYNIDEHPDRAQEWIKGGPIPQTIIYTSEEKLDNHVGFQKKGPVLEWLSKFRVFKKPQEKK